MLPKSPARRPRRRGFSLVELLISISVLSVLLLMIVSLLDKTQETWGAAKTRVSQFRDARIAFESLTRNLSRATLNTYYEYYDDAGDRMVVAYGRQGGTSEVPLQPSYYDRFSELHFLVDDAARLFSGDVETNTHAIFFQAPLGDVETAQYRNLGNLLNGRGYFIHYSDDSAQMPGFLASTYPPKFRSRLMEYRPPSERNRIYDTPDDYTDWYGQDFGEVTANSRVIADNIIALVISPLLSQEDNPVSYSIAPNYFYDTQNENNPRTKHQLPPLVRVTMVAIDEESALRLGLDASDSPDDLVNPDYFRLAGRFQDDLADLERDLVEDLPIKVNYRVFSATVGIRGSKWSDESLRDSGLGPGA